MSLVSCSSDDVDDDTYQGLIEYYNPETEEIAVRVTNAPSKFGIDMPKARDLLYVNVADFSEIGLEENKRILFSILSAENRPNVAIYDWGVWVCKIKILKVF